MKRQPSPKPDLITKEEFVNLRAGDIVLWHNKTGSYFRTVQAGPHDDPDRLIRPDSSYWHHVSFTKRVGSKYPSTMTGYGYNDMRRKISVTGKRQTGLLINAEEFEKLFFQRGSLSERIDFDLKTRNRCRRMESLQQNPIYVKRLLRTVRKVKELSRHAKS